MFEEKKHKAKPAPIKRNNNYRQVSVAVLVSCYTASAAIAVIAVSEALRRFAEADSRGGAFYAILAVLGALFSVFITVMNNRNKKLIAQGRTEKGKKSM